MKSIYLCDIDGTLAHNGGHRSFYDESKVLNDTPLPTVSVIKSLVKAGCRIIYFSGRTESCFDDTAKWLQEHVCGDYPELYMRKSKDYRADEIIKREMYDEFIKDKYTVIGVFDDRKKVKRMWVELGLWVWDCNQLDVEF